MWTFQVVCTELTGRSDLSTASWRTLTCKSGTADCNPVSEKALQFLSRNRCQSHLCVIFYFFFYFLCESTSAWLLFITVLSSTSLVLSSLQSATNTQIKSLCGSMNPLREVDSKGVLKGAGRTHVGVSRPRFSEGGQGQGLFFVSHEYSLVAVRPRQPLIVRAQATCRQPAAHYRFFFFKPQGWGGGGGRGRGGGTHTDWL